MHHDSFQWTLHLPGFLSTKHGASIYSLVSATDLASEAIDSQKKAFWFHSGTLSEEYFYSLMEFDFSIQNLVPNERRFVSPLDFKPDDDLLHFFKKYCDENQ